MAQTRQPDSPVDPPRANPRALMIKNLIPMLPERGKIKIGMKGAEQTSSGNTKFQPPQKVDHFIVTTLERGPDGNFKRDEDIHKLYGDKPTRLPVRLLYNDPALDMQSSYACYRGRQLWCRGDGESASRIDGKARKTVPCPCERIDPDYPGEDKCKYNGRLSAIIDGAAAVGGVWVFRTTSLHSTKGLISALGFIAQVTGGALAGIPLDLTVSPKQITRPDGKQQIIYVVGLEYRGTIEDLRNQGYRTIEAEVEHRRRINQLEASARQLLAAPLGEGQVLPGDDPREIVEEFYPDQARSAGSSAEAFMPAEASAKAGATADATTIAKTSPPHPSLVSTPPPPKPSRLDALEQSLDQPPQGDLLAAADSGPGQDQPPAASAASSDPFAAWRIDRAKFRKIGDWIDEFLGRLERGCKDDSELCLLRDANEAVLDYLKHKHPKEHADVMAAIARRREAL